MDDAWRSSRKVLQNSNLPLSSAYERNAFWMHDLLKTKVEFRLCLLVISFVEMT